MIIRTFHYEDGSPSPLSNFYPWPFELDGREWATVEHYFQAMKTTTPDALESVRAAATPGLAKRIGRKCVLRLDWDAVKLDVMRDALAVKFAPGSPLAEWLLATGDALLIEGNTWHDQVWGACTCERHGGEGRNWLGALLHNRRAELRGT
jgi:ribA/ribD-fused uncharacterized protein